MAAAAAVVKRKRAWLSEVGISEEVAGAAPGRAGWSWLLAGRGQRHPRRGGPSAVRALVLPL